MSQIFYQTNTDNQLYNKVKNLLRWKVTRQYTICTRYPAPLLYLSAIAAA